MNLPFPLRRTWALLAAFLLPCGAIRAQFAIAGPELRLNGRVEAVDSDAAGNVYLGGSFNEYNGTTDHGIGLLRLTPGGAKHATWDIRFITGVSDLLVHGNFLYVGGSFSSVRTFSQGQIVQHHLLRIHLSGANEGKVDTTWLPNVNGAVTVLETDGTSLFIGGSFSAVNGTGRTRLAKILIGGANPATVDPAWNPAPNNPVDDLEFAGSWIYVSGGFNSVGGLSNNYLARLSPATGAADPLWKPDVNRPVGDLEASATHLYFGGDFTQVEGATHRSLGRYSLAAGAASFDASWKPDPDGEPTKIVLSGSSLYIAGVFTRVSSVPRRFMAKVDAGGSGVLDGSFTPEPNGAIGDMKAIGANLLAGGRFNTTSGAASAGYAMMSGTTGAALAAFAGTITSDGVVFSMIPAPGGMIIGGLFDSVGGVPRTSIARLNSNGSLDTNFNVPIVGYQRAVYDMKLDGSTLYFCGDFISAGGAPTQHIARVNAATGAVDTGWFTKPLTPLRCLETDANYVYFGSTGLRFVETSPNVAANVFNVARVSKGTPATVDPLWTPAIVDELSNPATASVTGMQMYGDKLIIGGHFAFIADPLNPSSYYQRICLAALSTTGWGEPAPGWSTQFLDENARAGTISELLLHNGALYVAGHFLLVNGNEYYYVAKINPANGAHDLNFDVSPLDSEDVFGPSKVATLVAHGGHLYLGGSFDLVYVTPLGDFDFSPYIARVDAATGVLDYSWYPYPNGAVTAMAMDGENLWIYGSFNDVGGVEAEGPVIIKPFTGAYQDWLTTWFSPGQLGNSDFTAPFQDPDGDGIENIVEAMFGTDPFDGRMVYQTPGGGSSGLPLLRRENIGGQDYLTVEFTRWKASANAGVVAIPQFGDDLVSWPRPGVMVGSPVSVSATRERVKFRDTVPNAGRAFGRVEVLPQVE